MPQVPHRRAGRSPPTGARLSPRRPQADEIYARTAHAPGFVSMADVYPEGTLLCSGLSKSHSLGGWRIGIGVVPDNEIGRQLVSAGPGSAEWCGAGEWCGCAWKVVNGKV